MTDNNQEKNTINDTIDEKEEQKEKEIDTRNYKEVFYDKLPFTYKQVDIFVKVMIVLVIVLVVVGVLVGQR